MKQMNYKVIQCPTCGAPMSYDTSKNAFYCPSCNNTVPYSGDDGVEETSFAMHHVPVDMIDGMYRLNKLSEPSDMAFGEWKIPAGLDFQVKQKYINHRKHVQYSTRKMFSHICPECGGDVQAFETQNIWNCSYCGNKFIKEELIESGKYETYDVVDTGDDRTPHFAIPFAVSREEAKMIILRFADLRPRAFADQNLNERVNDLWTYYIPAQINDATLVMQVESELGKVHFLQDIVNWVTPLSNAHSYFLFHDIGPWDLSKIEPFSMKFAEGDVFFDDTYPYDSVPMLFAQENILRPMVLDKFSKLYPSERKRVNWLRREIRTRKTVMLPVYFLDKPKNGSNVYFMVNGQTGAVAAIGRGEMKGRKTLFASGQDASTMGETTIQTDFLPVIQNSENIYKVVSKEEAFEKYRFKQRKLTKLKETVHKFLQK